MCGAGEEGVLVTRAANTRDITIYCYQSAISISLNITSSRFVFWNKTQQIIEEALEMCLVSYGNYNKRHYRWKFASGITNINLSFTRVHQGVLAL